MLLLATVGCSCAVRARVLIEYGAAQSLNLDFVRNPSADTVQVTRSGARLTEF
ncbi:hypothetical protein [Longimicrobium terrae]|uniref:Uncharacterized protein n=1 Tax=Longimicrobium terrae TaxID=1639882 RepID=A0A841H3H4_9BACT|nr:hypothetical protein [Longimicrobium terrae]MBB4638345.1 hypothetical protein [Longimicrobium terrae]MBB6072587.1 hypothetical protein [Longimicrobium terrae]NNC28634.1 hypothetical protein [Longimicrobium terrae]